MKTNTNFTYNKEKKVIVLDNTGDVKLTKDKKMRQTILQELDEEGSLHMAENMKSTLSQINAMMENSEKAIAAEAGKLKELMEQKKQIRSIRKKLTSLMHELKWPTEKVEVENESQ